MVGHGRSSSDGVLLVRGSFGCHDFLGLQGTLGSTGNGNPLISPFCSTEFNATRGAEPLRDSLIVKILRRASDPQWADKARTGTSHPRAR